MENSISGTIILKERFLECHSFVCPFLCWTNQQILFKFGYMCLRHKRCPITTNLFLKKYFTQNGAFLNEEKKQEKGRAKPNNFN
jgi:hypothetical protein